MRSFFIICMLFLSLPTFAFDNCNEEIEYFKKTLSSEQKSNLVDIVNQYNIPKDIANVEGTLLDALSYQKEFKYPIDLNVIETKCKFPYLFFSYVIQEATQDEDLDMFAPFVKPVERGVVNGIYYINYFIPQIFGGINENDQTLTIVSVFFNPNSRHKQFVLPRSVMSFFNPPKLTYTSWIEGDWIIYSIKRAPRYRFYSDKENIPNAFGVFLPKFPRDLHETEYCEFVKIATEQDLISTKENTVSQNQGQVGMKMFKCTTQSELKYHLNDFFSHNSAAIFFKNDPDYFFKTTYREDHLEKFDYPNHSIFYMESPFVKFSSVYLNDFFSNIAANKSITLNLSDWQGERYFRSLKDKFYVTASYNIDLKNDKAQVEISKSFTPSEEVCSGSYQATALYNLLILEYIGDRASCLLPRHKFIVMEMHTDGENSYIRLVHLNRWEYLFPDYF